MIEMPMRQEDALDAGEIDVQPARVVEPELRVGANIEQHAAQLTVPAASDEYGKTVTSASQLVEHRLAFMALEVATWRPARGEVNDLRNLRYTGVDARQGVGLVVHDDQDFQFVELQNVFGKRMWIHNG